MANTGTVGNWVGETTTTVGTGDITLGGPIQGFTSFASIGQTEFWYAIADGNNREAGLGNLSGNTFQRTTVYSTLVNNIYADNSPAPISLSGSAQIFSTFNKTAFDILDDGVDASNTHISDNDIHISAAGVNDGDTVVWNDTSQIWDVTGGFGEFVPPGNSVGQTLRWNTANWDFSNQVIIADSGDVGINNSSPTEALHVLGKTLTTTFETTGQAGIGTSTPHASSAIDINGAIYTENLPLIANAKRIVVTNSLPGTPDPNTIYFLTGP